MAPCTFGCSVFTRPPSISGQPVSSATSRTGIPASRNSRAVPPVEIISIPRAASSRVNSATPVLSYTLISARSIAKREPPEREGLASVSVRGKFRKRPGGKKEDTASVRDASLQLYAPGFDADRVFDFMAAFVNEVFCFLEYEFLKVFQAGRRSFVSGFCACVDEFPVKLLYLFVFVLWIGEGHCKSGRRMSFFSGCACHTGSGFGHRCGMGSGRSQRCRHGLRLAASGLAQAFRLDGLGGGSEMVLGDGAFFLHQFFAPHIHIFRVSLAQVVVT